MTTAQVFNSNFKDVWEQILSSLELVEESMQATGTQPAWHLRIFSGRVKNKLLCTQTLIH